MAASSELTKWSPRVLSILRIMAGLLFFAHGSGKLLGFPVIEQTPPLFSIYGAAGVIEIVTGILIAVGFLTRPAAFVASGLAAFAYFLGHAPRDFYPVNNGGDAAILFCFVFFYLIFAGPGPWSIDKR